MKLFITLFLLGSMSLFNNVAEAAGAHGVFRVVKGTVKIKSAQSGQVSRARIGAKVLPGDVISTEKDSRAKVVMVDNNEINISPDSEVKIEKYEFDPNKNKKNVLLNVIYGKVRSKVEQKYDGRTSKFQVKTPSAVAGVRGTDFITGYTPSTGASQVITFEGKVEFGMIGPGGQIVNPVEVAHGQMAEIGKGGQPASPKSIPKDNLKQMDQDSNAETAEASNSQPQAEQQPAPKKERAPSSNSGGDLPPPVDEFPPPPRLPDADPFGPRPMIPPAGPDCGVECIGIPKNTTLKINVQ